jgi:hypothetical protein
MAIACPVDLDTLKLCAEIQSIYARVATDPSGEFHFHRGAAYAAGILRYDPDALAVLPADTTAAFAGVANPIELHRSGPVRWLSTSDAAQAWICSSPLEPSDPAVEQLGST